MVQPVLPAPDTTLLAPADTQTIPGGGSVTLAGAVLGVAGQTAPVTWTGTAGSTGGVGMTVEFGSIPEVFSANGYTVPTNPTLLADGFDASDGLAILSTSPSQVTTPVTSAIGYAFSQPVPAGTSFLLWDPGVMVGGEDGPYTFTFSAADGTTPVSTAGWSVVAIDPFTGAADAGTYAFDAGSGALTVSNYDTGTLTLLPRKVILVTPDTPVTSLSVTAETLP